MFIITTTFWVVVTALITYNYKSKLKCSGRTWHSIGAPQNSCNDPGTVPIESCGDPGRLDSEVVLDLLH